MAGRNERDTCREFVVPRLAESGWRDSYTTEYTVRSDLATNTTLGGDGRVDYLLELVPGLPVGVVEAKREYSSPGQGLQQAIEYAVALDLPTAIASDGHTIIERDLSTGIERHLDAFPTPPELWDRYARHHHLDEDARLALSQPLSRSLTNADGSVRQLRYYQLVAINRALRAILAGHARVLLLMATGSGKTLTAMQLCWKLLSYWQLIDADQPRRILYVADRDALIKQPLDGYFRPVFGEGATRIQGNAVMGREIYFATYQSLMNSHDTESTFEGYPPDFFDLIIVDECHRGSVPGSSWRAVLDRFTSAAHIGLTATPKRDDNVDTYDYFGEPVFEYSLRQGIEDGYLAPYTVRRVVLTPDAEGWRPDPGEVDTLGRDIPDGLYTTRDFERLVSLLRRTDAAARHLSQVFRDRPGRAIIFCVDSEHAEQMRLALVTNNRAAVQADPFWVVRIVSAEGETGRRQLDRFSDPESLSPVVATTSRMLSTGIDVPDLKYVVLFRPIGSMVEFKQIVGRGSRLYPDNDKYSFEIVDYVGASVLFSDPGFDGEPVRIRTERIDESGEIVEEDTGDIAAPMPSLAEPEPDFDRTQSEGDLGQTPSRKYYVDGTEVTVTAEAYYVADTSTGGLRLVEYSDYLAGQVRILCPTIDDLRQRWADPQLRSVLEESLAARGVSIEEMSRRLELSTDTDPFDVLAHAAWNVPQRTRAERARLVRSDHAGDLEALVPTAREIIAALLDRYEEYGVEEMTHVYAFQVPPLSNFGSPVEAARHFGGVEGWRRAISDLQGWLYSA